MEILNESVVNMNATQDVFKLHKNKEKDLLNKHNEIDGIESRVEAIISKINMSMQDYQEEIEHEHE